MSAAAKGNKLIQIPIILALACGPDFLVRCRKVAAKWRLLVRACDAGSAWPIAVRLRPFAIILPSHLHDRAPRTFELLAEDAGARLVVLESEQVPAYELEGHLTEALYEAARARRA